MATGNGESERAVRMLGQIDAEIATRVGADEIFHDGERDLASDVSIGIVGEIDRQDLRLVT